MLALVGRHLGVVDVQVGDEGGVVGGGEEALLEFETGGFVGFELGFEVALGGEVRLLVGLAGLLRGFERRGEVLGAGGCEVEISF